MKGLLLKDFYNLSRMGKQYLLIFAGMSIWAYFMKNPMFISMYVVLCSSMLVLTSFSYDEYAKYDKYSLTMPVERKTLVQEKYALLLLATAGGTMIGIPLGGILALLVKKNFMEVTVTSIVIGCVFLISYSAVFPTIFKSGVEKARLRMIGVYLIIFVLIYILAKSLGQMDGLDEITFLDWMIPPAAVIVAMIVTIISYFVSLRMIENKEW